MYILKHIIYKLEEYTVRLKKDNISGCNINLGHSFSLVIWICDMH